MDYTMICEASFFTLQVASFFSLLLGEELFLLFPHEMFLDTQEAGMRNKQTLRFPHAGWLMLVLIAAVAFDLHFEIGRAHV